MHDLMKLARQVPLENGLTVSFYHHSHRYFGDYHRVRVEIICEVPVMEEYFSDPAAFAEARSFLGRNVFFRRNLELMGIPTAELENSLEKTIDNFSEHSLSYLASPMFPRRMVLAELAGAMGQARPIYAER